MQYCSTVRAVNAANQILYSLNAVGPMTRCRKIVVLKHAFILYTTCIWHSQLFIYKLLEEMNFMYKNDAVVTNTTRFRFDAVGLPFETRFDGHSIIVRLQIADES